MPSITTLPINPLDLKRWSHLRNLQLADPKIDHNGRINVLIGNGTLSGMLSTNVGIIRGKPNEPIAQRIIGLFRVKLVLDLYLHILFGHLSYLNNNCHQFFSDFGNLKRYQEQINSHQKNNWQKIFTRKQLSIVKMEDLW